MLSRPGRGVSGLMFRFPFPGYAESWRRSAPARTLRRPSAFCPEFSSPGPGASSAPRRASIVTWPKSAGGTTRDGLTGRSRVPRPTTSAEADDDNPEPCRRPGSGSSPSSGRGPRATCPSSGSARSRTACPTTVAPGVFVALAIEPLEVLHSLDIRSALPPELPSTSLNAPLQPLFDLLGRYTRLRRACPASDGPGVFIAGESESLEVFHVTHFRSAPPPPNLSTSLNPPHPPPLDLLGRYSTALSCHLRYLCFPAC